MLYKPKNIKRKAPNSKKIQKLVMLTEDIYGL